MKPTIFTLLLLLVSTAPSIVLGEDSGFVKVKTPIFEKHESAQNESKDLICTKKSNDFLDALDMAMSDRKIKSGADDEKWFREAFHIFGYTTSLPKSNSDKASAMRVIELMRRDNLVAAKLANDYAAIKSPSFKKDPFFNDAAMYIRNNSMPFESLDVDGQKDKPDPISIWLSKAAGNLSEAKKLLGPYYKDEPIRYYIMANTFDDGIALDASKMVLCGYEKDKQILDAVSRIGFFLRTKRP